MRNLKVDQTTGDLFKRGNNFARVIDVAPTNLEALAQNINVFLKTNETEIFIDPTIGIPWLYLMTNKSFDIDFKNAIIREAVLSRPFVQSITSYTSQYIGEGYLRRLVVTMEIKAAAGIFKAGTEFPQEA